MKIFICILLGKRYHLYVWLGEKQICLYRHTSSYRVKFSIYLCNGCITRSITKANTNICTYLGQFSIFFCQFSYLSLSIQIRIHMCLYQQGHVDDLCIWKYNTYIVYEKMTVFFEEKKASVEHHCCVSSNSNMMVDEQSFIIHTNCYSHFFLSLLLSFVYVYS